MKGCARKSSELLFRGLMDCVPDWDSVLIVEEGLIVQKLLSMVYMLASICNGSREMTRQWQLKGLGLRRSGELSDLAYSGKELADTEQVLDGVQSTLKESDSS